MKITKVTKVCAVSLSSDGKVSIDRYDPYKRKPDEIGRIRRKEAGEPWVFYANLTVFSGISREALLEIATIMES